MYKVAVLMTSGKMIAYPYSNLKNYVRQFRQSDIYDFVIFTQETFDECFAFLKLGKFDSLVICSNTSNDLDVKNELENHKSDISEFIKAGHGVLILMQYGLLTNNQILDIIDPSIFDACAEKGLYSVSPIELSKQTIGEVEFNSDSILLQYPNNIIKETFVNQALKNPFREAIAPGFIKDYQMAYFSGPIRYTIDGESDPICICSGSDTKRIVITTLPVDLQEQLPLLENMISYICRGRPAINLLKCKDSSKCVFYSSSNSCNCEIESLLKKVNVHYTSRDIIDPQTDYNRIEERAKYNLVCDKRVLNGCLKEEERVLPIRTALSFVIPGDETNSTVLIAEKSIIKKWVDLGLVWIESRLDDKAEKWDTLDTTKEVALLYSHIGKTPNSYIKKKIFDYLQKHNINKNSNAPFSFDGVDNATEAAHIISDCFELGLHFDKTNVSDQHSFALKKGSKSVDYDSTSLYECAMEVLYNGEALTAEDVINIFERFVSARRLNNASWESDVLTTAIVLRALLKIEGMSIAEKYIGKFNLICSCFEDESEKKLTQALLKSVAASRDYSYEQYKTSQERKSKIEELEETNKKLNGELEEQKAIEDRTRFHITIWAALIILSLGLLWLFIGFILYLPKNLNVDSYWEAARNYMLGQGLFQSILSFGALLVVAVSFVGIKTTNKDKRNIFYRIFMGIKNKCARKPKAEKKKNKKEKKKK